MTRQPVRIRRPATAAQIMANRKRRLEAAEAKKNPPGCLAALIGGATVILATAMIMGLLIKLIMAT